MTLFPRSELRPGYSISRVIKGHWQLSENHLRGASISTSDAVRDMHRFVEAGITTFDVADIYTGAEEMIGAFLRSQNAGAPCVQVHTKYVPDMSTLATVSEQDTRNIIERSLKRLGIERLDLVQFHWWNYAVPRYVETALSLQKLQQEGKIRLIGVTNFDEFHLNEILDAGVDVASAQIQYSLLDRRPGQGFSAFCAQKGIGLLCYGTLAGGFLSEKYRRAADAFNDLEKLENRSLPKYRLIIDEIGGWDNFQRLLETLSDVAARHDVGIGEIAIASILARPQVHAAIVGAHNASHLERLRRLSALELDNGDLEKIEALALPVVRGGIYELERTQDRHKGIMHVNLNARPSAPA